MADVFADTSGWASFFVRSEPWHATAEQLMRRWQANGTRVVTTNYILTELVALFTSPIHISRERMVATIETIKATSWVEVVHVDDELDAEAWNLLRNRLDKAWSLVDCTSFALMRRLGISEALATDHHFEQAGFVRLLK